MYIIKLSTSKDEQYWSGTIEAQWTDDIDEARRFYDADDAADEIRLSRLENVEIVSEEEEMA